MSVVICTYNRDQYLRKCLDHLAKQSASSQEFEILVINNSSTDDTEEVCKEFQRNHPDLQFDYLIESQQGLSFCRNRGLLSATGEYISYLDDDAYADPTYVTHLIQYFNQHPEVDAIGGKIHPEYQSQEPKWMSKYLLPLIAALDMGNLPKPFTGSRFPIGANMAFRREVFSTLEPFRTNLGRKGEFLGSGEEKDVFIRLKKQGKTIHYVPSVQVKHFISDERLEKGYIRRMAQGIGFSEAIRIQSGPFTEVLGKWMSEFFKIGATLILALVYAVQGQWSKGSMLIKFRLWLLSSFIKG